MFVARIFLKNLLADVYAANNMLTLTEMVSARGLAADERVRYQKASTTCVNKLGPISDNLFENEPSADTGSDKYSVGDIVGGY
jgi:hypothetical protein